VLVHFKLMGKDEKAVLLSKVMMNEWI
jgi:hypothetical protein